MRNLIVIACLISFASASFYDALDNEAADLVAEFWYGMDSSVHLAEILPELAEEADVIEEDVKEQLARSFRDVLEKALQHIRDNFEKAEEVAKSSLIKAAELVEKLKTLVGVGEELSERIQERVKEWIRIFVERIDLGGQYYSLIRVPLELDEKDLLENFKQNVFERLNLKELVEYIKARLGHIGEVGRALLEALGKPGALEKLKDLLQVLLPGGNQDYSLSDFWQKVRDFFGGLGGKFKEFGAWVKGLAQSGWSKISTNAGKLKDLAKTVTEKAKTMSKKVAEQALQFFNDHKEEIGQVAWSLLKKALVAAIAAKG